MKKQHIYQSVSIHLLIIFVMFLALAMSTSAEKLSTWKTIKQRGSFRVGAVQWVPYYSKNPSTGEWSGIGIAIGQQIAKEMGVTVEFVETTWGNAVAALEAKQIDVMFGLTATPKRALAVDFTNPLFYQPYALVVREDLSVETWEGFNHADMKLAVIMGSAVDAFLTILLPNATLQRYPHAEDSVASFQSGRSDGFGSDATSLMLYQNKISKGQFVVPNPAIARPIAAGVRREADKTWRDFLNTCILFYYTTGKLQEWYEQALREQGIDPHTVPPLSQQLW